MKEKKQENVLDYVNNIWHKKKKLKQTGFVKCE